MRGAERCIMSRALPRDSEARARARALHVRSGTGRTIKSVIACNCRAYVFPIGSERKEEEGRSATLSDSIHSANVVNGVMNYLMNIYDTQHTHTVYAFRVIALGHYFDDFFYFTQKSCKLFKN